ncbi:hypothetical protein CA54_13160 [Symmachiella macrocystis]|uniref:Uncharacterized protein n=1 Tax=Symmachiella macrocystis TaxID=2527985 RepID=A0A5C6BL72_9PLAN|nr:hypothetical protein CA54_13160 [Symmachiella macrocystis]
MRQVPEAGIVQKTFRPSYLKQMKDDSTYFGRPFAVEYSGAAVRWADDLL